MELAQLSIEKPSTYKQRNNKKSENGKSENEKSMHQMYFLESDGVIKMIKDYNEIIEGKSKKGLRKQNMIKAKINDWLKSGMLKETDLKQDK